MVRFSDFIRLIRYGNCAMSAVAALLGALVSRGPDVLLHPEAAGAAMAVVFLFTGAGNTINDYLDAEIDRKRSRSSRGCRGLRASSRTRRLNCSQLSSRFTKRSQLSCVIVARSGA